MGLGLGSRVADRRCGFAYTPAFGRMEASCVRLLLAGTKSGFSRDLCVGPWALAVRVRRLGLEVGDL